MSQFVHESIRVYVQDGTLEGAAQRAREWQDEHRDAGWVVVSVKYEPTRGLYQDHYNGFAAEIVADRDEDFSQGE